MIEYKKYRWFYTSNKTLVVGGKSAEQNDSLLADLKKGKEDYVVMHTTRPRSPFSVLLKKATYVKKSELQECAVFTACFSSAWKEGLKEASIDVFNLNQLSKKPAFKEGMWNVSGKVERMKVKLELGLAIQDKIIRAVPLNSAKVVLKTIVPGKMPKEQAADELAKELKISKEDLLSALPTGNLEVRK